MTRVQGVAMAAFTMVLTSGILSAQVVQPRRWDPAQFAPIKQPFIVGWYCWSEAYPPGKPVESRYANVMTSSSQTAEAHNGWLDRGILPLAHVSMPHGDGPYDGWTQHVESLAEQGFAGICVDEWLANDERNPGNWDVVEACRQVKESYPQFAITFHTAICPASMIEALRKGYIDNVYCENYTYYPWYPTWMVSLAGIRRRMKLYEVAGVTDKVVWHLAHMDPRPDDIFHDGMNPERLEREIQLVRRWAPGVAGICFYTWSYIAADENLVSAMDELTYEYFIRPAPKVTLRIKQAAAGAAKVTVKASRSAFGGEVTQYRIFLNGELVSEERQWVWDAANAEPGDYRITAHAITSDHYRGSKQLLATLESGALRGVEEQTDARTPVAPRMKRLPEPHAKEPTAAFAVVGDTGYLGVGHEMQILDIPGQQQADKRAFVSRAKSKVGTLRLPEIPERLAVSGDLVYVADGHAGVLIVDVSAPEAPVIVGRYEQGLHAEDICPMGDVLLVAAGHDGLVILDTSDPAHPEKLGSLPIEYAWSVTARDGVAYVSAGLEGLVLVDIADPAAPRRLAAQTTADWALRTALAGDIACVADWSGGLRLIDVSDPTQPREVGNHFLPWAWDVAVKGNIVYVADENVGLHAVDITDPAAPVETWEYDRPDVGDALNVVVSGDRLFSVDGWLGLIDYAIDRHPETPHAGDGGTYSFGSVWNVWEKGVHPGR